MEKLDVSVNVEGAEDLLCPLAEAIQSFENFPEFPLQVFRSLVTYSLHDISVSLDSAALAAGDLRGTCRAGRNFELVTATLLALNAYLHGISLPETSEVETRR